MIERLISDAYYDEPVVLCPVCGGDLTHHQDTVSYRRSREDGPTTMTVMSTGESCYVPEDQNPSPRRHAVVLEFECEAGHAFTLQFVQHKGHTFVRAEEVRG